MGIFEGAQAPRASRWEGVGFSQSHPGSQRSLRRSQSRYLEQTQAPRAFKDPTVYLAVSSGIEIPLKVSLFVSKSQVPNSLLGKSHTRTDSLNHFFKKIWSSLT